MVAVVSPAAERSGDGQVTRPSPQTKILLRVYCFVTLRVPLMEIVQLNAA